MTSYKNVKQVYQKGYAKMAKLHDNPRIQKVISIVSTLPKNGKSLLDIGCGDGVFTLKLANILGAKKVFGIDIAKGAIDKAKKNGIEAKLFDIDERDLPFDSSSIDYIYCGNLIELIEDPDHLLSEAHRVLKKNGVAIITVPNLASWGSRIAVFLGYLPFYFRVSTKYDLGKMNSSIKKGASTGFIRLQTKISFSQLVSCYNFEILKVVGAGESTLPRPLQLIDSVLTNIPSLAFQLIFVLKKN